MRVIRLMTMAILAGCTLIALAQSSTTTAPRSDRERLIGAWHLASLGEPGPDGRVNSLTGLKGMLIYTRDGHMSVQLIYPDAAANLSNDYVLNGYEASFGSYDLDEGAHTVTHHVQGSITAGLVGKSLTRVYQLKGDRLFIKSVDPKEHWLVTWEHE